jgi:hypothetical protein
MQTGVVSCCVLVSWLVGCQVAQSVEEERAPQLVEAPVAASVALPAAEAAELAPVSTSGVLSLLTLGAAVIGAVATPTSSCRADACLAASIIDRTAQLEAATRNARGLR